MQSRHMIHIANQIKALRASAGLSQKGLAQSVGLSVGVISKLEQGHACALPTLFRVCAHFGSQLSVTPDRACDT